MERKYELLYVNKEKHGNLSESDDNFYDLHLREKVIDSEIPNNKSNEEILNDIVSKHSNEEWVTDLPTIQKVKVRSMLSDLEHPREIEPGDCIKIGDKIWYLTPKGFKQDLK